MPVLQILLQDDYNIWIKAKTLAWHSQKNKIRTIDGLKGNAGNQEEIELTTGPKLNKSIHVSNRDNNQSNF